MNKYFKYFFLIVLPLLCVVIFLAQQLFTPLPNLKTKRELINYAEFKQSDKGAYRTYVKILKEDSLNSKYIYLFAKSFYKIDDKERKQFLFSLKKQGVSPILAFDRYIKNKNSEIQNTGYYGKAVIFFFKGDNLGATRKLDSITNNNYPGYYYLRALISQKREQYEDAYINFIKEAKLKEFRTFSYVNLFYYFVDWKEYENAKIVLKIPEVRKRISSKKERELYFKTYDFSNYFSILHQHVYRKIDNGGLLAAFFIMIIWLFYLLKLSLLSKSKTTTIFIGLFLSIFTLYPTLLLYDFMKISFNFKINGNALNDLLYTIFGIGFIEELAKLIPLLILILFKRKDFKSPMDYILVGSASALGFSFVENLIYFTGNRLDIISLRAFVSVVMHMACTSIASYGLVVLIFNSLNYKTVLRGLSYFFLATIIHGFFDFWLISESVKYLAYLSIPTMILGIFIWVKILNNCLNNSNAYENKHTIKIDRLNFILLSLLSSVICIEFLIFSYKHGTVDSYVVLKNSIFIAIFYIPYLSFRLSRIDIAPKGTSTIDFIFKNKAYNLDKILNHKAKISSFKSYGTFNDTLPLNGIIINRLNIESDNEWFEFIPENDIILNGKKIKAIIIKAKNKNNKLTDKDAIIYSRIQYEGCSNEKLSNIPFIDFALLNID